MFNNSNALLHTQLGLEAKVGIGLCFLDRTKLKYHISLRIQQEFALTQHYFFSPLAVFSLTVRWQSPEPF